MTKFINFVVVSVIFIYLVCYPLYRSLKKSGKANGIEDLVNKIIKKLRDTLNSNSKSQSDERKGSKTYFVSQEGVNVKFKVMYTSGEVCFEEERALRPNTKYIIGRESQETTDDYVLVLPDEFPEPCTSRRQANLELVGRQLVISDTSDTTNATLLSESQEPVGTGFSFYETTSFEMGDYVVRITPGFNRIKQENKNGRHTYIQKKQPGKWNQKPVERRSIDVPNKQNDKIWR